MKDSSQQGVNASEQEGQLLLDILVTPRASRAKIGPAVDGRLKVAVTAPPVDGKANAAVIALLSRTFGVSKTAVSIVSGDRGKRKRVRIEGATIAALKALVQ